jgi:hypothetical protein
MHTHVLNTYNHTGERPQGCQAREHACRQLLKLVALKAQRAETQKPNRQCAQSPQLGCCVVGMHGWCDMIAVAKQKVEIDQMDPGKIVSACDRDSSGGVFVRFRSSCGITI